MRQMGEKAGRSATDGRRSTPTHGIRGPPRIVSSARCVEGTLRRGLERVRERQAQQQHTDGTTKQTRPNQKEKKKKRAEACQRDFLGKGSRRTAPRAGHKSSRRGRLYTLIQHPGMAHRNRGTIVTCRRPCSVCVCCRFHHTNRLVLARWREGNRPSEGRDGAGAACMHLGSSALDLFT